MRKSGSRMTPKYAQKYGTKIYQNELESDSKVAQKYHRNENDFGLFWFFMTQNKPK